MLDLDKNMCRDHFSSESIYELVDSQIWVNVDVTIGSIRIKHLVFEKDLVLLASLEQHLQHALHPFAGACDQAGMKIRLVVWPQYSKKVCWAKFSQ